MFGVALMLFFVSLLALSLWKSQRDLQGALDQSIAVEEPLRAAAHELETKAAEFSLKVQKYVATNDPAHRERAQVDVQHFERRYARLEELPLDAQTRAIGRDAYAKFHELQALGALMMDTRDSQEALSAAVAGNFLEVRHLFDEKLLPGVRSDAPQAIERLRSLQRMADRTAEANVWAAHYLRREDPAYLERIANSSKQFMAALAQHRTLPASGEERRHIAAIERLFDTAQRLVKEKIAADRAMGEHEVRFAQLRREFVGLLDQGLQQAAYRRLTAANKTAGREAERNVTAVLILFPLFGIVALAVGALMVRRVKQRVRELLAGAEAIRQGKLSHRVPERGSDEFATLARAFNRTVSVLEDSSARLTAANRELESFAYSVAHDLRAPLRAIGGFSHILAEAHGERLDPEGRRLLERVEANSQKMAELIDNLLEFSRLGRQAMSPARIDMTALMEEVVGETRPQTDRAPAITVRPLPPAWGDRSLIRQAVENLVSNAIKYSGTRDRPAIEIAGETKDEENVYSVKDNGVGFDMRYYEKLFGVFQRLHRAEEFPGVGVGLAIVKRMVARHGGRVWAESQPDAGATFYFALPAAER
jgi:signal transduction histidine kinase